MCVSKEGGDSQKDNVPLRPSGPFFVWTSTLAGSSQQACGEIDIYLTERLIIMHLALHRALFPHSYLLFNQTQEVKIHEGVQEKNITYML